MRSTLRIILAVVVGLVMLVAAAWLMMATVMRGPLAGDLKHDFGPVQILQARTEFEHTFRLTNRTKQSLTIRDARPDCSCVRVNASLPVSLEPGELMELPIVMQLSGMHERRKKVNIRLDCGDAGLQNLWLTATIVPNR